MSGCGTRIVLRGQKPLALCDRCPCFGSLYPPPAALTFAAQSIICAFGLAAAAPRSPYRHLELCGIVLTPDKASLRLIIPNWIIRRRDFLCQTRKPKLNGCTTASTMPLSNAAGCTPAGPGPAAPPDDEQYRGRPLPGGASDRGLTRRQGREKAYVLPFGRHIRTNSLASLNAFCCKSHRRSCWRGWGWVFVLRMRGVAP